MYGSRKCKNTEKISINLILHILSNFSIIYGNIVPYWVNYSKLNKGYLVLSNHNHFINGIYRKYKRRSCTWLLERKERLMSPAGKVYILKGDRQFLMKNNKTSLSKINIKF